MKWPLVSLPEICRPKQWPTIPKTKLLSSGYPVFGANGRIGHYSEYNHEEPTILITCRGATCGSINVCEPKSYVTGNAMALDALDEGQADLRFLFHALEIADFSGVITGVAQPQITRQTLARLEIPLPPLAEQKRIAEILDAADALRAKRGESLAQLDALLQSTFLVMFGDPVTNPMGWEVVELASLIECGDKVNYGVVQPGDDYPDGMPLIRVGDFVTGELVTENVKLIDPAIEEKYRRSRLNGRELLISCVGSIGTVCKVPSRAEGFNIARAVARVPLRKGIDRGFMLHCLRSEAVQRHFLKETRTVSQPTLNISLIKNAPVIQPPDVLQRRFASIVESVEQQKSRLRDHLEELDNLFASLQSRAFNGEL